MISVLSGIALWACFPPLKFSFLAWLALVPLFFALLSVRPAHGFFIALVSGGIFFIGIFHWILEITQYKWMHHALLDLYFGAYIAIFGLTFCLINVRRGAVAALISAPFLWISQEYLRANMGFLALPWGFLAHSQYENTSLLQIASITGAYGVSFMVVLGNAALTAIIFLLLNKICGIETLNLVKAKSRLSVGFVVTASLLIGFSLIYGKITAAKPLEGHKVKVGVVQGNIAQLQKWDPKQAKAIMQVYKNLTLQAAKENPDLIVWPETATPKAINLDPKLKNEVGSIAKAAASDMLIGSAQVYKFKLNAPKKTRYYNSAFLISDSNASKQIPRYDKIKLVPFGEYLPLRGKFPWSHLGVPDKQAFLAGREFTVFKRPSFQFSTTICWENIFPDVVRQFVNHGAQFIVNITNEAWFGETAAPYQFLSMNVMRAVENRVYVVRCANTGISCFIDPNGRIVGRVKSEQGQDIFTPGILCRTIVSLNAKTFYTKYGDIFAWGCHIFSLGFLMFAVTGRKGIIFRKENDG